MKSLSITVNKKVAKDNTLFSAGLTAVLATGVAYIIFNGSIASEGWLGILLGFGLCTWIFGFLMAWVFRLYRLSKFDDPILTITETGIIDHWQTPPKSITWDKIEYSGWKTNYGARSLKIVPIQKSPDRYIRSIFSIPLLEWPAQYFLTPAEEIAQFMLDHAPEGILQ